MADRVNEEKDLRPRNDVFDHPGVSFANSSTDTRKERVMENHYIRRFLLSTAASSSRPDASIYLFYASTLKWSVAPSAKSASKCITIQSKTGLIKFDQEVSYDGFLLIICNTWTDIDPSAIMAKGEIYYLFLSVSEIAFKRGLSLPLNLENQQHCGLLIHTDIHKWSRVTASYSSVAPLCL